MFGIERTCIDIDTMSILTLMMMNKDEHICFKSVPTIHNAQLAFIVQLLGRDGLADEELHPFSSHNTRAEVM